MDAEGALDSLLGCLTNILVDEAQLLGRVRGDVEFIKDEMECMNSLILQLTEAQHRDHLVRAWMKQVVGLTRDCEGNVEHYIHYIGGGPGDDGLLGYLRRIPRFLRMMPARHRIATRIRELKVRARDVGDRRQRYGVKVPSASATVGIDMYEDKGVEPAGYERSDFERRALLFECAEPPVDCREVIRKGIDTLVKWLSREAAPSATSAARDYGEQQARVFCILPPKQEYGYQGNCANKVAERVYQDQSIGTLLRCKVVYSNAETTLYSILKQISGIKPDLEDELISIEEDEDNMETWSIRKNELFARKIQGYLKGNRFLIVIQNVKAQMEWNHLLDALLHSAVGCHPGSAIIVTPSSDRLALSSSPCKIINMFNLREFYENKVDNMVGKKNSFSFINDIYFLGAFTRKMFLHLLYVKPVMTEDESSKFDMDISKCVHLKKSFAQKIVMWCYNELPSKYRGCLLYLAIFPQGHIFRTTTLARRWAAEGLITTATRSHKTEKAADEAAEHYWDELLTRGFITPVEISAEGNIKSCTLHHEVHKVIAKISREVNIAEMSLPTDWAHRLSIHNRIERLKPQSDDHRKGIVASLPSLAASPQWQLLKLLDLEGCHGLEKHHLKSICKILLLKYLSLRNTDVTELPKQIKELQCLETLDIRQTKVRLLAKKPIVLPMLKHFLAGHKLVSASNGARTSEEQSIATVSMPLCIKRMKNMEILSHVQVTNTDSELAGITRLLKLRKLGVALQGKNAKLSDLLSQIEKLQECLRSLSIRMDQTAGSENHDATSLPQFIESINISGIAAGRLPRLVQEHHQLAKMTLSQTHLKKDDLCIIGKLHGLRWLRLQNKSYTESELVFKEDEFQSLNFVLVEVSEVSNISFVNGTAPKLEMIVWSFDTMETLSGIDYLPKLKTLELNGDCNLDLIEQVLAGHPNDPILKHKPQHQC